MLDVEKYIKEYLYFEGKDFLEKPLTIGDRYLGSGMCSKISEKEITIYYLESSDQITIPSSYINLFQGLNTRDGDRLRGKLEGGLPEFISIGIELPGILLHKRDPRGIRSMIGRMVVLGTSEIRRIIPELKPWTLSNVRSTIEI